MTGNTQIDSNIQNLLIRTDCMLENQKQLSEASGENFNIFKILDVGRLEVLTHSKFLFELLSTKGSHGMGDNFLNLFVSEVLKLPPLNSVISVKREFSTESGRRVDFVIKASKQIIGIEMKIDAKDQKDQLKDYYESLKIINETVHLYYLTLDGKKASKSSLGEHSKESKKDQKIEYEAISFKKEILNWVNLCIKESATKPVLREALIQYKVLLENLTGKRRELEVELGQKLALNPGDLRSALTVSKAAVEARIILQSKFWNSLKQRLESYDKNVLFYGGKSIKSSVSNYYKKSKNNRDYGLKYKISSYNEQPVYMFINLYDWVHYGLRLTNHDGDPISNIEAKETILKKSPEGNAYCNKHSSWIVAFYKNNETPQKKLKFNTRDEEETLALLTEKENHELLQENLIQHLFKIEKIYLDSFE